MEIRLAFPNEVDAIMQVMEDAKNVWQMLVVNSGKMASTSFGKAKRISIFSPHF